MIKELDSVVLTVDLLGSGLVRGDLGTVVMIHEDGLGFEVEFATLDGHTLGVMTLDTSQVRPIEGGEIPHARPARVA